MNVRATAVKNAERLSTDYIGTAAAVLGLLFLSCNKPERAASGNETTGAANASVTAQKAELRGKVGVVMKNGDVKPVARADFVLSKVSLTELYDQELVAHPPLTSEEFCRKQGFSPQLLELIASFKWELQDFDLCLIMTGLDVGAGRRKLTIAEVAKVPELFEAYRKAFDARKSVSDDAKRRQEALESMAIYLDRKVEHLGRNHGEAVMKAQDESLLQVQAKLLANQSAIAKTSLSGEFLFRQVPVGDYFLSNVDYSTIGESKILWDVPVKIEAKGENYVELSNDNAWRIR